METIITLSIATIGYLGYLYMLIRSYEKRLSRMLEREDDLLNRLFAKDNTDYHKFKTNVDGATGTKNVLKDKYLKDSAREG